jgi:hypothetical protein
MAFVGLAVCLAVAAACSTGTGNGGTQGSGGQVTVRQSPATTEPPETPSDTMGGTGSTGMTGSTQDPGSMGATGNPGTAATGNDGQLRAAIGVSQQWLGFVDQGQYAESWSATGSLFQANMQQQQWVQTLTGARTPLGSVVSREVAGSEIRASLPGAPAGQYALVSFATNFQNKPDVIETVTMMDESGQWKVVGYTAQPRAALQQQQQQQAQPTPTPPQP